MRKPLPDLLGHLGIGTIAVAVIGNPVDQVGLLVTVACRSGG
jgi:hypothetical protein